MTNWDMTALAIDPGVTTGFCLAYIKHDGTFLVAPYEKRATVEEINNELNDIKPDNVICESFAYRPYQSMPSVDLFAKEVIGVVQLWGKSNSKKVFMQTPAQGKGFFSDNKLKELSLYTRRTKHGRDAMRHLLHWFLFGSGYQFQIDLDSAKLCMKFQLEGIVF